MARLPWSAAMNLPILIVLHQEHSTPGRIGQALRARGFALDIRRPRFDDPLPETLDGHAGAVIFGGPQSANDADEYVRREIDWIRVPLNEDKPFLGICLGAQMLARQLGGRVYRHPEGHAEVGYYPIRPTAAGREVCDPWPDHVYQWHREGFDLPGGGVLLAEGDAFPVQAFRYGGSAYALQFHMDVTHAMMCRWTTRGHERMLLPGAKPRDAHFEGRLLHDDACRAWLGSFIDYWLKPALPVEAFASNGRRVQRRAGSSVSTR
jgi:GMP synthase (glutamine-hydrolysing)